MATLRENLQQAKQHHQAGRLAEAEQMYQQVLRDEPENPEALCLLAAVFESSARPHEAIGLLQTAIRAAPEFAHAHNFLGAILAEQGLLDEAITHFRKASRLRPEWADPSQNLCSALAEKCTNDGLALAGQQRWDEAIECYRQALDAKPNHIAAHGNLGNALLASGRGDEAASAFQQVLEIDPRSTDALYSLGQIAKSGAQLDDAVAFFRRALAIDPDHTKSLFELAFALVNQNQLDEATECYQRILAREPENPDGHFGLALVLLLRGQWAPGWAEYEWRFRRPGMAQSSLEKPRWTGEPLAGRTILLRGEQGLGDTLQFIRYAELLKAQGAHVVLECRPPLVRLMQRMTSLDRVVERGQPLGDFDVHAPLLSLPGILQTTLETIPARIPYLSADEATIAQWREELARTALSAPAKAQSRPLRVGIAWQGSPTHAGDMLRSFPLAQFEGIARLPGVQLYSLQAEAGREQLAGMSGSWPLVNLGDRLGDFANTAAIVSNLDLVISCDSSLAHLAGALGARVWVALALVPDWRWLLDREESPWYPTMRLFRQSRQGDWPELFARITAAVAELARTVG